MAGSFGDGAKSASGSSRVGTRAEQIFARAENGAGSAGPVGITGQARQCSRAARSDVFRGARGNPRSGSAGVPNARVAARLAAWRGVAGRNAR